MGVNPLRIHAAYRADDAAGFALNIRRGWARLAPDIALVFGAVGAGASVPEVPEGATILALAGRRWFRAAPGELSLFDDERDPLRQTLGAALRKGQRIVPVLFEITLTDWSAICRDLPPELQSLGALNAVELHATSFSHDLERLVKQLRSPDPDVPWTEAESMSIIHVESAEGGLLKWWSNRDMAIRVFVDGSEVGSLSAWNGRLDWPVAPGRHTVQAQPGPLSPKSGAVLVELTVGSTVALVCDRNIFTGGLSLAHKSGT